MVVPRPVLFFFVFFILVLLLRLLLLLLLCLRFTPSRIAFALSFAVQVTFWVAFRFTSRSCPFISWVPVSTISFAWSTRPARLA